MFQIGTLLNYYNWKRCIIKCHVLKKVNKREFFILPATKNTLGITDGRYPLNKQWLVKLRGKNKRLKYSRLVKLCYYSTINN